MMTPSARYSSVELSTRDRIRLALQQIGDGPPDRRDLLMLTGALEAVVDLPPGADPIPTIAHKLGLPLPADQAVPR